MKLEVSSQVLDTLLDQAASAHPRECCGILLGDGDCITSAQPAANVHRDPDMHFEIDPQALVDAHRDARCGGPQVLGYYHSHPNGLTRPSIIDEAMASGEPAIWAIIASGRVTFWQAGDAGFAALPYEAYAR